MALSLDESDMYDLSYDSIECSFLRHWVKFNRTMPSCLAI
jgi:hypothetical protein